MRKNADAIFEDMRKSADGLAKVVMPDELAKMFTVSRSMYVTLTWGASVVLSIDGSEDFLEGLETAINIARQIRADGRYTAPDMTISKVNGDAP